ncbi:MAG: hypothetical protein ACREQI_14190 [Candidatus Binataceae bacterium]
MKRGIIVALLLLIAGFPGSLLAAAPAKAPTCTPLPAASTPGFATILLTYMDNFCYLSWEHDAQIRSAKGTHPYVKVYYSPSMWTWLEAGDREATVPDGAMLVKEQYQTLTAPLSEWTIMVKDHTGSWDGWYWADFASPKKGPPKSPPSATDASGAASTVAAAAQGKYGCGEPTLTFAGFGSGNGNTCIGCHASAADGQGTFSSTDYVGAALTPPDLNAPPILDNIHQIGARLADMRAIAALDAAGATPLENAVSPDDIRPLSAGKAACMPPESLDHVVAGGQPTGGPEEFLTSDQCASCHDATGTISGTGRADIPSMLWPDAITPLANLSEYGEWRYSMMGLAGRDPIFFSQLNSESTIHDNLQGLPGNPSPPLFVQNLCLHCHGVMGQRQLQIDTGGTGLLSRAELNDPNSKYGALGRDGISCLVCHHISPEGLGDPSTFTGDFNVGPATEVYAQYPDPITLPMDNALGITPEDGSQIGDPAMCGSCHTIILPVYAANGNQVMEGGVPKTFYEQATFPEWLNSNFATVPCQTCHMPDTYHGSPLSYKIANIEDNTFPAFPFVAPAEDITMQVRQPFNRHTLLGINVFALEMFGQFRTALGLYATDPQLPGNAAKAISSQKTAVVEAVNEAVTQTATVDILSATRVGGTIQADVTVTNLAGHSFPSGVGFRRAFVDFQVLGPGGKVLWASGDTNKKGVIVGIKRKPLITEYFTPKQQAFQPHFWIGNPITSENQAQIYEELVADPQGQLTTSFLSLDNKVKDNRLQPQGWSVDGPFAEETGPAGGASDDPDYTTTDSPGSNTIRYEVPINSKTTNAIAVSATLYYQAIPPYYLYMRSHDASGPDTSRLNDFTKRLRVKGTPVDNWRLQIATQTQNIQ